VNQVPPPTLTVKELLAAIVVVLAIAGTFVTAIEAFLAVLLPAVP